MAVEYQTLTLEAYASVDDALNAAAAEGWRVVNVNEPGVSYLMEKGGKGDPAVRRQPPQPATGVKS